MKSSLSLLLLLPVISLLSCSQQTKKIVEESGENNSIEKKVYYVLKDDQTIKHGSYRQYWNGDLAITGFYKMGRKDSVWKRYDSRGSVVSKKTYTENKRTGIWEFYKQGETTAWQYDFSNRTFRNRPEDTLDYSYESLNGEWIKGKADREPVWLRSTYEWQSHLNIYLRYPPDAIDEEKQGSVLVEIMVDENGKAIDYSVGQSVFQALDEESIRVTKLFQPEFLPAEKEGRKVKVKVRQPIVFRIETED